MTNKPTLSVAQSMAMAWRHYQEGTHEDARMISIRVLQVQPQNADAHRVLGLVYQQKARYAEAIGEFTRAEKLGLRTEDLQAHLAKARERLAALATHPAKRSG